MAKMDEEFGKWRKEFEEIKTASNVANKSMGSYAKAVGDAVKLTSQLGSARRKLNKLIEKEKKLRSATTKEEKEQHRLIKEEIEFHEKQIKLYEKQIKKQRKSISLFKAAGNTLKDGVWSFAKSIPSYFVEQDKAVKQATLSMGLMGKQSEVIFNTMNKTAIHTTQMGVNMKGLAKLQQSYSEQLGKSVILNEKGLTAMAELQEGAFMGDSGLVAEFTSNLENFGYAADGARDLMEEGVNLAQGMGVNAHKFAQEITKSLKLAQGYNFKGGIKALEKMTAQSIRFKISLQSIAGIADKLITPEGAVEMAASLQVLGGAWSKLADPFTLMYQARNDMEGLQESIIKATAGTAQFNKKTKEFDISAMEMHRLREVAKSLGMDYKDLAEGAKAFAKNAKVKSELNPKLSPEAQEFVASTAQWNKKKQDWTINIKGNDGELIETAVKDLGANMNAQILAEKKTLEERAIASKSFDQVLSNLLESLKTTMLPFLEGLNKTLLPILNDFIKSISKDGTLEGIAETMKEWGETAGKFLGSFFDDKNGIGGIGSKITSALVMGFGAMGIAKTAMWVANGMSLGVGFNMTARVGSGMPGMGGMPGGSNKSFMGLSKASNGRWMQQTKGTNYKTFTKPNMFKRAGYGIRNAKVSTGGLMAGGYLGSAALDYGRSQMDDQDSGWGKAMGIGSKALSWGATGAMLGSFIPGIGNLVGAGIGAGAGALYGAYDEMNNNNHTRGASYANGNNRIHQDFISRPGSPVEAISSKDTLIGAKKGGPIDKMMSTDATMGGVSSMMVDFKPLKIEFGDITINGVDSKIDFKDDPMLLRELSGLIQSELRKAIGGGKLNPNPI